MQEFKKVIEDTQKKMKNGRMIGYSPESKETAKEEQKPLSELFKAKPGTWECGVCYVRNKAEDTKCCSCETPKPGSEPEPAAGKFISGIMLMLNYFGLKFFFFVQFRQDCRC